MPSETTMTDEMISSTRKLARRIMQSISDLILVIASVIAIFLGVLDILKLYEMKEFHEHINIITVMLISILVISSIIEKHFVTRNSHQDIILRLKNMDLGSAASSIKYAGIKNIYTSRSDYSRLRGHAELESYLSTAEFSIEIVAFWLSQGHEVEGIVSAVGDLLKRRSRLTIKIAIVNPSSPVLNSLADYVGLEQFQLRQRASGTLNALNSMREELTDRQSKRLQVRVYDTIPLTSIIILDGDTPNGRIQIDFKLYKTPRQYSFGLELVRSDSLLYDRFYNATMSLIRDSKIVQEYNK